MNRLCVLGSTGSIGTQTLEIVRRHPDAFQVIALTAGNQVHKLAEQIQDFHPLCVSVQNEERAEELKKILQAQKTEAPEIYYGMDGFVACAIHKQVQMVVAAMVGMIGLQPVMEAITHKKDIALANKETLVTAGHLIMPLVKEYGVQLLPVDSEHSAIAQCLEGSAHSEVEELFLTASGGPFLHHTWEELEQMTVQDALAHPNWSMGRKITIDSATMVNKGLEIIEACWLFDVGVDQIHVLVQPQSVVHSMVGFRDGAVIAQMGMPDMRVPIQYALFYKERPYFNSERMDFETLANLHFEKPNTKVLKGVPLAKEAFKVGGSMTTVMNAANEYAVAAFLQEKISLTDIYRCIRYAMDRIPLVKNPDLETILSIEQETYERLEKERIR